MKPEIPEDLDEMFAKAGGAVRARQNAESEALRQQRYEESVLRKVLKRFGLAHEVNVIKRRCEERTGQFKLIFHWFLDAHETFPVYLFTRKIPYMHKITQVDLYRRFTSCPFFKAYDEAVDMLPATWGKPAGLVFDWPAPGQAESSQGLATMIVHNRELSHDYPYTRFTRRIMTDPPQSVHVERFADFLEGLAWVP